MKTKNVNGYEHEDIHGHINENLHDIEHKTVKQTKANYAENENERTHKMDENENDHDDERRQTLKLTETKT